MHTLARLLVSTVTYTSVIGLLSSSTATAAPLPSRVARQSYERTATDLKHLGCAFFIYDDHLRLPKFVLMDTTDEKVKQFPDLSFPFGIVLLNDQITDASALAISRLRNLESLSLRGTRFTDEGVKKLSTLKRLRDLDLRHLPVTDESIKAIRVCKQLESLDISGTLVTDEAMYSVHSFGSLHSIDITNCTVGASGCKILLGHSSLRSLSLGGRRQQPSFERLLGLTELNRLVIEDCDLESCKLDFMHCSSAIREVRIFRCKISERIASQISGLRTLGNLQLEGCDIRRQDLELMLKLRKLTVLNLTSVKTTAEVWPAVMQMKGIRHLGVGNCGLNAQQVSELSSLPVCEYIDISGNAVGKDGMRFIEECHSLRSVNLSRTMIDNEAIVSIAKCHWLEELILDGTKVTDACLASLRGLKRLNHLSVQDTAITLQGIQQWIPDCHVTW